MSTQITTQTLHPFTSYPILQKYLSGEKQLAVLAKTNASPSAVFWGPWQVMCLHVKTAISHIGKVFFREISHCTELLGAKGFSLRCKLLSLHCLQEVNHAKAYTLFKERFLFPARNVHAMKTEKTFARRPIQRDSITDPDIKRYIPQDSEPISIASPLGVCRGICEWFLYLQKKSISLFPTSEKQLLAIAKLFEKGAPKEAAVIQALPQYSTMQKEPFVNFFFSQTNYITEESLPYVHYSIHSLDEGSYFLYLSDHVLAYIKEGPDLGYLYDPNYGLIKLDGDPSSQINEALYKLYGQRGYYFVPYFNR